MAASLPAAACRVARPLDRLRALLGCRCHDGAAPAAPGTVPPARPSFCTIFSTISRGCGATETTIGLSSACGTSKRLELAVEQSRRHEMIGACGDALPDQIAVALQKDEPHVAPRSDQDVAIGALERRAGDDAAIAAPARGVDPVGDGVQPRPAIGVVKRLAVVHLFDIGFGVQPIAVLVDPMQAMRQHRGDRALAGARHAHHDQNGNIVRRCWLHA